MAKDTQSFAWNYALLAQILVAQIIWSTASEITELCGH